MKFYGIIALAALSLVACSDNEPKPDVIPPPLDGGSGSEPTPLTPDPVPDSPPKVQ